MKKINLTITGCIGRMGKQLIQNSKKDKKFRLHSLTEGKIKIPDGTQDGKQFRLKGKGMPFMQRGDYGDLYVQIKTEVPISLNKEQKDLLERFRKIENERSNPSIRKFFEKAKSFWKN